MCIIRPSQRIFHYRNVLFSQYMIISLTTQFYIKSDENKQLGGILVHYFRKKVLMCICKGGEKCHRYEPIKSRQSKVLRLSLPRVEHFYSLIALHTVNHFFSMQMCNADTVWKKMCKKTQRYRNSEKYPNLCR